MSVSVLPWLGLSMVVFVTANTPLRWQRDRPLDIRDTPDLIAIAHRVRDGLRRAIL